jgi:hypothetical protein
MKTKAKMIRAALRIGIVAALLATPAASADVGTPDSVTVATPSPSQFSECV